MKAQPQTSLQALRLRHQVGRWRAPVQAFFWRRAAMLAGVLCALFSPEAQAQLQWRVSVKVILDSNGNRPTSGNVYTDQQIQGQIDTANAILDQYGRGYDYVLTEIVN